MVRLASLPNGGKMNHMDTVANLALGAFCALLFYEAVKFVLPRPIKRKR